MGQGGNEPPRPTYDYYPLHSLPPVLGIVWCQFPTQEMPSKPGPKTRPALVRAVMVSKGGTKAALGVTYGTSKLKALERPHDLIIANLAEMNMAGLPQATRFDLDNHRTVILPWAKEFFTPREGYKDPLIGVLPQSSVAQLQALIVLRRQMAAEQRALQESQRPDC